jgi:YhcH/YjgK/YiaL family protein
MIVTDLEHMGEQFPATPAMKKALDWLKKNHAVALADGRIDIDGDKVYAMIQSYTTVASTEPQKMEAHKTYIDVQFQAAGEEVIGWALTYRLKETMAYDAAKDVWLGTVPGKDVTGVRLSVGQMAILWPSDAHAPRLAAGAPMPVKKIVIKVAV